MIVLLLIFGLFLQGLQCSRKLMKIFKYNILYNTKKKKNKFIAAQNKRPHPQGIFVH